MNNKPSQRADYTFKFNQNMGRHGWLRLTPAYSVKLVHELIKNIPLDSIILDPFAGTATTCLVSSERGILSHGFDINKFLLWLGRAKCRNYSKEDIQEIRVKIEHIFKHYSESIQYEAWLPNIHNIERWWSFDSLKILAILRQALVQEFGEPENDSIYSLVWIAFCRLIIETSSASFAHVSMSFQKDTNPYNLQQIQSMFQNILESILESVQLPLTKHCILSYVDSKNISSSHEFQDVQYSHVITSPPYPNRISYIRELRPYMYWTKFLEIARDFGELDWLSIGGTWGVATSRLHDWSPVDHNLFPSVDNIVSSLLSLREKHSFLMAKYVWKYFHDMYSHLSSLRTHLKDGAFLAYIVGNSSFYGIQVPTDSLLIDMMKQLGYTNIGSKLIRKRNSKKELFEYCVYATWKSEKKLYPFAFEDAQDKQLSLFPPDPNTSPHTGAT